MLTPQESTRFKKDIKRVKKQGKDLKKLKTVILKIAKNQKLEQKYKDHTLTGNWGGFRECHIEPDWLLIYKTEEKKNVLKLARTGSHSELFR